MLHLVQSHGDVAKLCAVIGRCFREFECFRARQAAIAQIAIPNVICTSLDLLDAKTTVSRNEELPYWIGLGTLQGHQLNEYVRIISTIVDSDGRQSIAVKLLIAINVGGRLWPRLPIWRHSRPDIGSFRWWRGLIGFGPGWRWTRMVGYQRPNDKARD